MFKMTDILDLILENVMDKARFYFVDASFFSVRIKFLHIVFSRLLNKYVKKKTILDPKCNVIRINY